MHPTGIDHLVLTVHDLEATCGFYGDALGATVITFGPEDRTALQFDEQKINLHEAGAEFDPHARSPTPGSGDFCLLVEPPIEALADRLGEHDIEIVDGPVEKHGARGSMRSVYVRDPDGNLVELAAYEETD
ncbi:VOC family protein [Halalkalicoccus jeotgali]|uniref:Biphenyl-2,3-diol 1,2-dioxygenase protein n=1 Tax=Halalkalicoccus jeotgali (strain DSM 18796 / CECT 7217 / JCM 14584 / KCTC 4019 / B3) TaxID=795797 RepID=D8J3N7_HALJB|nr:VOC family protein [Halalkalicoccus jeotgali]ADJ15344.1 putative biphenyl-2,3-diol 1,2-dioxygenase protein [Halalkalicoccus jeotgali B3]ELY35443.1 putative biphenyl-2,3-diol 1,2-dioxygenase protein [Halalkalicoccus jeotgali B3]